MNVAGGWYHREPGKRGRQDFRNDTDRGAFWGWSPELPVDFLEIHAFVPMDNHYHLLLRCREANLSEGDPMAAGQLRGAVQ